MPSGAIDVTRYGAKGDGATDNTQAIQNALNAARPGQTVFIPAGNFSHGGVLNIPQGVNLQGAGAATTMTASNSDSAAIKLNGGSTVSDLTTFTSSGSRDSQPDQALIDVTGSGNGVSQITTIGAKSNGIRLDGASNSTIQGNLVQGSNADGIALMNGSSNNTIKGNEVYQAGDDSFSDDSYLFDNMQDTGNVFEGNLSLSNSYGRGIAIMGAGKDTVTDNTVEGSQWMSIVAGTDSNSRTMTGSDDIIEDNKTVGGKGDAVDVMTTGGTLSQNGPGMTISGNGDVTNRLSFTPATNLVDRSKINANYRPGTGNGANNGA